MKGLFGVAYLAALSALLPAKDKTSVSSAGGWAVNNSVLEGGRVYCNRSAVICSPATGVLISS